MKLDLETWALVFPLLEESQDVPTAELDARRGPDFHCMPAWPPKL
jgi:hypothetical protein